LVLLVGGWFLYSSAERKVSNESGQHLNDHGDSTTKTLETPPIDTKDGWIPLFNGQDLTDWKAIPPQNWRVENGVIHGSGPDGFLVTQANDFEDFHLVAEYRIN